MNVNGVPLTMRRLSQLCKKLGLSRQRNIDDGTYILYYPVN